MKQIFGREIAKALHKKKWVRALTLSGAAQASLDSLKENKEGKISMRGDLSGAHWIQMCVKEAETKAVRPVVDAEPGFVVRLVESCLVQVQEEHRQRLVVAVRAAAVVQVPHTSDEIASHGDVLRCFEPHLQIRGDDAGDAHVPDALFEVIVVARLDFFVRTVDD